MNAVRYATSLAPEADAHLTLLHVMEYDPREVPELYDTLVADARLTIAESRELSQAISRERLDTALSDEARTHCRLRSCALAGHRPARPCGLASSCGPPRCREARRHLTTRMERTAADVGRRVPGGPDTLRT